MSSVKTGDLYCNKAIVACESVGHKCDGPFTKVIFHGRRKMKVHVDIFGVYDFISVDKYGRLFLHQVTSANMKSKKIKKIMESGVRGILWIYGRKSSRVKSKEEIPFRIFEIFPLEKRVDELRLKEGRFIVI